MGKIERLGIYSIDCQIFVDKIKFVLEWGLLVGIGVRLYGEWENDVEKLEI